MEFYGGYQVQSETGVDLTLLKENLRLTPPCLLTTLGPAAASLVAKIALWTI